MPTQINLTKPLIQMNSQIRLHDCARLNDIPVSTCTACCFIGLYFPKYGMGIGALGCKGECKLPVYG